jgi:hypothetical protein
VQIPLIKGIATPGLVTLVLARAWTGKTTTLQSLSAAAPTQTAKSPAKAASPQKQITAASASFKTQLHGAPRQIGTMLKTTCQTCNIFRSCSFFGGVTNSPKGIFSYVRNLFLGWHRDYNYS